MPYEILKWPNNSYSSWAQVESLTIIWSTPKFLTFTFPAKILMLKFYLSTIGLVTVFTEWVWCSELVYSKLWNKVMHLPLHFSFGSKYFPLLSQRLFTVSHFSFFFWSPFLLLKQTPTYQVLDTPCTHFMSSLLNAYYISF